MALCGVPEAIEDFRKGKMIILVDDEDRENEGDLTLAAELVTPEVINFMAKYGRGLICLSLTEGMVNKLQLPLMVPDNTSKFKTAFTVSIDGREGVSTGISASDRATTIKTAIADDVQPDDLVRPGHIFPLLARDGGVLVRAGQTEGSVDLARLSGLRPAGVICEIMNEDGSMARLPDLQAFAKLHNIKILTIASLINYRLQHDCLVHRAAVTNIPTKSAGSFKAVLYENDVDDYIHLALMKGEVSEDEPTLVRVHSGCLTGDVFGSERCDCGEQLHRAMEMIEQEGKGVILYLYQEGRGIGLANKLKAYALQDQGKDTVQANRDLGFKEDLRDYGIGAQILRDLGVRRLRLMTNNPKKIVGLEGYGLRVVERVPIEIKPRANNLEYLRTKQKKMGHLLNLD
jgi:3,4-dihydroxy 2-butanone 4-phosphate synthase/GTP cyclohydrolase II